MKNNEWIDSMTPHLKLDMKETEHQAYTNGCSLIDDAELLYQAKRYARAMALAVLAEEEFSKAFILRMSLNDNRWDSTIYQSLRRHSNKQGIAESMRDFFKIFLNDYPMEINKNEPIFTQAQPSMPLRSDIMEEHIKTGKKLF
jgi:AbiV family abortive infection protein